MRASGWLRWGRMKWTAGIAGGATWRDRRAEIQRRRVLVWVWGERGGWRRGHCRGLWGGSVRASGGRRRRRTSAVGNEVAF